jgi:cysteine desulfuration protein SufE
VRPALQAIVDEFADYERELRLELLLDYANGLPALPERFAAEDKAALERVQECQTPLFAAVEVEDGIVRLYFDAPPEAPTTRGYASVLHAGLDGATVAEVLETPGDFYVQMKLGELISPLRLRGMCALLGIIKRRVAIAAGVAPAG